MQGNAPAVTSLFDELVDALQPDGKEETENLEIVRKTVTVKPWTLLADDLPVADQDEQQHCESNHSVTLIVKSLDWSSYRSEKMLDIGARDSGVGDEEDAQRIDGCHGDKGDDQQVKSRYSTSSSLQPISEVTHCLHCDRLKQA